MKLYHNARCAKSREAKKLLEDKGLDFEIVEYMKEPLTQEEMEDLLDKLDMNASELLRKNEKIWKEDYKDKDMADEEILLLMIEHPKLMERPILEKGDKAVVGRPPEKILEIV